MFQPIRQTWLVLVIGREHEGEGEDGTWVHNLPELQQIVFLVSAMEAHCIEKCNMSLLAELSLGLTPHLPWY